MIRMPTRLGKPLRVLFIPSWYPSAVDPVLGTFVREHAKAAALHHDVSVIYPYEVERPTDTRTQVEDNGYLTIRQPFTPLPWRRLFPLHYLLAFHRATRALPPSWQPDVIHLHVGYPGGLAAAYGMIRWKAPLVYTEQAGPLAEKILATRVARWCLPRVARRAHVVAPVSSFLARDMAKSGLLAGRVAILPNVVDTDVFQCSQSQGHTHGSIRLLAAALLVQGKGIEHAIDAVSLLRQGGHRATLTIAGDGPLRTPLEARAIAKKIKPHVRFSGILTKPELAAEMKRSHVFILPSERETFSVVVVEAMAAGLPVVATRCGGPEELITSDTGLLVETTSPEALARAVLKIVADPQRFDGGAARARKHYSVPAVGDRLVELYRSVMQ